MTKVLIVDDSPVDRQLAGRLLEKDPGPDAGLRLRWTGSPGRRRA